MDLSPPAFGLGHQRPHARADDAAPIGESLPARDEASTKASANAPSGFFGSLLAAMHDSRHDQAMREICQYRHLVDEARAYAARCKNEAQQPALRRRSAAASVAHGDHGASPCLPWQQRFAMRARTAWRAFACRSALFTFTPDAKGGRDEHHDRAAGFEDAVGP
jgi:hypothetical protein